jgi:hypothetical protein
MAELRLSTVNSEPDQHSKNAIQDEWYDLLPVEKKLIFISLGMGIVLLVVFVISFGVFK